MQAERIVEFAILMVNAFYDEYNINKDERPDHSTLVLISALSKALSSTLQIHRQSLPSDEARVAFMKRFVQRLLPIILGSNVEVKGFSSSADMIKELMKQETTKATMDKINNLAQGAADA